VDDDGNLLINEETEHLEVAHIFPHALVSSDEPFMLLVRGPSSPQVQILKAALSRISPRYIPYAFWICSILAFSTGSRAQTLIDHIMPLLYQLASIVVLEASGSTLRLRPRWNIGILSNAHHPSKYSGQDYLSLEIFSSLLTTTSSLLCNVSSRSIEPVA